ncbi:MAG: hypothetical protein AAF311_01580 [Pseudomonadota bacterium]
MDTLLYILLGGLIANSLPHIVNGVSGRPFHTPFARPPVRGLSSPVVNVVWGVANLYAAAALYHLGIDRADGERLQMGAVGLGFTATLILLAWLFARLDR